MSSETPNYYRHGNTSVYRSPIKGDDAVKLLVEVVQMNAKVVELLQQMMSIPGEIAELIDVMDKNVELRSD